MERDRDHRGEKLGQRARSAWWSRLHQWYRVRSIAFETFRCLHGSCWTRWYRSLSQSRRCSPFSLSRPIVESVQVGLDLHPFRRNAITRNVGGGSFVDSENLQACGRCGLWEFGAERGGAAGACRFFGSCVRGWRVGLVVEWWVVIIGWRIVNQKYYCYTSIKFIP